MEETKHCSGCGQVKPVDAFGWKDKTKGLRQARCPDCARAYQAQWYQRNKHAHKERSRQARQHRFIANDPVIQAAKAVPCSDCGQRFSSEQMDFDHVRGTKRFDIGSARFRVSPARLRAEIGKCEVVCAVCHRLRTHRRTQS